MAKKKKAAGAPTKYSKELGAKICFQISTTTLGLKHICDGNSDFPDASTVYDWLGKHEEFAELYARAKEMQADRMAEEILDIADDGSNDLMTIVKGDKEYEQENKEVTNRSRLRVEARKWLMSKLKPKKYGERLELSGNKDNPLIPPVLKVEFKTDK